MVAMGSRPMVKSMWWHCLIPRPCFGTPSCTGTMHVMRSFLGWWHAWHYQGWPDRYGDDVQRRTLTSEFTTMPLPFEGHSRLEIWDMPFGPMKLILEFGRLSSDLPTRVPRHKQWVQAYELSIRSNKLVLHRRCPKSSIPRDLRNLLWQLSPSSVKVALSAIFSRMNLVHLER